MIVRHLAGASLRQNLESHIAAARTFLRYRWSLSCLYNPTSAFN